jgi:hypothetical protein
MGRKLTRISADDVYRAMTGAKRAGFDVARCELTPEGHIVLTSHQNSHALAEPVEESKESALERWLADENPHVQAGSSPPAT